MATPLRAELARAYQRLFGTRGGLAPAAGGEIIPVQIMDGPAWPAARRWVATQGQAAVAASNSLLLIENTDPLDSGSLVVIDWMRFLIGAAGDIIIGIAPSGTVAYTTGPFTVVDVAPAPPVAGLVKLANVAQGSNAIAFTPQGYRLHSVATIYETPALWPQLALPPQTQLIMCPFTVNVRLDVSIGGRYYSAL